MDYTLKPIVYGNQFRIWLHDTFPEWSKNDIDDVLEFILSDYDYTEIYFVNNDEDPSLTDDEGEREIFTRINRIYAELRNIFCDTDYVSIMVSNW